MKTKNYPWRFGWFLGMYYMANGIYQGYASKYFESTGMSTAMLSVILAFTPLVSIFTQPLWGTVGDRAKAETACWASSSSPLRRWCCSIAYPIHSGGCCR